MARTRWNIRTYTSESGDKPVEAWITSLDATARAAVLHVIDLLEKHGPDMPRNFVRHLGSDLWELRVKDRDGTYRVIYFHWKGRTFGLRHGFTKKTQKTPRSELETATARHATWIERTRKR